MMKSNKIPALHLMWCVDTVNQKHAMKLLFLNWRAHKPRLVHTTISVESPSLRADKTCCVQLICCLNLLMPPLSFSLSLISEAWCAGFQICCSQPCSETAFEWIILKRQCSPGRGYQWLPKEQICRAHHRVHVQHNQWEEDSNSGICLQEGHWRY